MASMVAGVLRDTRERILKAAEEVLGECGYRGARLHEIARRVGVQKASLFHYFSGKEDLYRAVLSEGFGETERVIRGALAAEGMPLDRIRSLVEAYVELVIAHPARTKILLRQSLGDEPPGHWTPASQRLLALVIDFITQGQRANAFAPVDPHALVLGVVGMVAFFFTSAPVLAPEWLGEPSSPENVERVKRHVVDVVERCLATDVAARPAPPKRAAV
jgi:AcrR family transcriptional regulator